MSSCLELLLPWFPGFDGPASQTVSQNKACLHCFPRGGVGWSNHSRKGNQDNSYGPFFPQISLVFYHIAFVHVSGLWVYFIVSMLNLIIDQPSVYVMGTF